MVARHAVWYNFIKMHPTLKMTSVTAASVSEKDKMLRYIVVAIGFVCLGSATVVADSGNLIGKWCGNGTLEILSTSPGVANFTPPAGGWFSNTNVTAGKVDLTIDGNTVIFRPPGSTSPVTLGLTNGKLAGTSGSRRGTSIIEYSKCS